MKWICVIIGVFFASTSLGQYKQLRFQAFIQDSVATGITVSYQKQKLISNEHGEFTLDVDSSIRKVKLLFKHVTIPDQVKEIEVKDSASLIKIQLYQKFKELDEVVVTGTMKEISKKASPVPVEVYSAKYFQKLAPPNLFEAIGLVNGVKPQLNCNICNTGDIHINGMEGAYTQVLIDGMPIVSGLATVYGLMGIPLSMIERIEVIKGPAASLYGSEAMGGTINVITKNPLKAPQLSFDINTTNWKEINTDIGAKLNLKKAAAIIGINYFNYTTPVDHNHDGFTDVTIQNRLSVFNNWSFKRKSNKPFQLGGRWYYEDRWGGQMNWSKAFRGSDSIYGESIYTNRLEFFTTYQLPTKEKLIFNGSFNIHQQNSYYGITEFNADQYIGFAQLYWDKTIAKHNLLAGLATKFLWYDDNTTITSKNQNGKVINHPDKNLTPAFFLQDEIKLNKLSLLPGFRIDHHPTHKLIYSPRFAMKWQPHPNHTLRSSVGTGFRVVNIFTEDHAALTGAREVVIKEALQPERSVNAILNWQYDFISFRSNGSIEGNLFYSYFSNKIIPDYQTNSNQIIYENLQGHSISRGAAINFHYNNRHQLKTQIGITYMDVFQKQNGIKETQLQSSEWSGTFSISKNFIRPDLNIELSGSWYGPMRLPILPNDYRPEYSPWFCLANIQMTKKWDRFELYGGVKNLLHFIPKDPIMRPFDPFDKQVNDPVNNPYGYTFDPSYNYAPIQGRRVYVGIRFTLL